MKWPYDQERHVLIGRCKTLHIFWRSHIWAWYSRLMFGWCLIFTGKENEMGFGALNQHNQFWLVSFGGWSKPHMALYLKENLLRSSIVKFRKQNFWTNQMDWWLICICNMFGCSEMQFSSISVVINTMIHIYLWVCYYIWFNINMKLMG